MDAARTGFVLALIATFLGAAFLIPYKAAGQLAPREAVVMAMLVSAAVLNTLATAGQLRGRARLDRIAVKVACVLAVCTVIGNVAVLQALATLEPAMTSVITHTQIFFVVALSWVVIAERPSRRFGVGALVALVGFAVMRMTRAESVTVTAEGVGWGLLAASMWGSMHVVTRKYIRRIQPVLVNALRLWLAVAGLACVPRAVGDMLALGARPWLYAAAAALVGPFLARVCLMYSVRHITAYHSSLIGLVGPVFALVLGFAAFGTYPAPIEIAGGVVILAGVAIPIRELGRR